MRAVETHLDWFYGLKGDYNAYRQNRFTRNRRVPTMGASADYHFRSEADYLRLMEIARDIDRNDVIVGQAVNRYVSNVCQEGFTYDPDTGDPAIDADLKARWLEWSADPTQCDAAGERTFDEMAELALRAAVVDGDAFGVPLEDGTLEAIEGHRCRSASRWRRKNVVHGVEQSSLRRRQRFYFVTEEIGPRQSVKVNQLQAVDAYDETGNRNVFQMYMPRRFSQSRGVTAFAPIVDPVSQHDDISFAKLVQQQIVSCWVILRERQAGLPVPPKRGQQGSQTTETIQPDGYDRLLEDIAPGMEVVGKPGESLKGFSPNVPNPEYFPHMRMTLTYIGINLDTPLIVLLLDASETNFSGWRGALDMAKISWRKVQKRLCERWHVPTLKWKVRQWMMDDPALDNAQTRDGINLFAGKWHKPSWPYIQPLQDASADLLQARNALNSHRRIQQKNGRDWVEVAREHVEDNSYAIRLAIEESKKIKSELDVDVHWRELISLPTPDGIQVNVTGDEGSTSEDGGGRSGQNGNNNPRAPAREQLWLGSS